MSYITLHPTKGVNPFVTTCPVCMEKKGALILMGNREQVLECNNCHKMIAGHRSSEPCPKCRETHNFISRGTMADYPDWPDTQPCSECQEHMKAGIIFRIVDEEPATRFFGLVVVKEHVLDRINPQELRDQIRRQRLCNVPRADAIQMGLIKPE